MKRRLIIFVLCAAGFSPGSIFAAPDDYLVPADNLVLKGVPKIPVQMAEEVRRYTE